ncbi:MAG: hypothetical protein Kow00114_27290 [Kiloniellaceae bacterium]
MIPLRFTAAEAATAYDQWGANCGPGAIAAICGLSLNDLRPHLGTFERKRYTNPTLMWQVLKALGVMWTLQTNGTQAWPVYGLARVQWEGPWTRPGAPRRARYRHTHWVAAQRRPGRPDDVGIFDINCMNAGGWVGLKDWAEVVVPWILKECEPQADGRWHLTHVVEVDPLSALKVQRRLAA